MNKKFKIMLCSILFVAACFFAVNGMDKVEAAISTKAVKTITNVTIAKAPSKTVYYQYLDQRLSYKGLQLKVNYEDGSEETVDYGATSSQGDAVIPVTKNLDNFQLDMSNAVAVSIGGKTAAYAVVYKSLTDGMLSNLTYENKYTLSDASYIKGAAYRFTTVTSGTVMVEMTGPAICSIYSASNMTLVYRKTNETNISITELTELLYEHDYVLVVSPIADINTNQCSITIREVKKADSLSIAALPIKTTYEANSVSSFDFAGLKVKVHYANGYEEIVGLNTPTLLGDWFGIESDLQYATNGMILPGVYQQIIKLGDLTTSFPMTVNKFSMSGATLKLATTSYTYDGKAKTPTVTVTFDGDELVKDTDYTVVYTNNTKVGTATVTVTGKGNYTGTKKTTFTIKSAPVVEETVINLASCSAKLSKTTYIYNKLQQKPAVTVTYKGAKLAATKYNVKYQNNVNVGTATVTLTGKGNVTGTKRLTFTINPAKVTGLKLKAAKKSATVSWGKRSEAGGYEVYVSLKKSTGFAKKATITKNSTVKKTIKKLKSKKNYYFKVRAFKKVSGKTYYGAFSDVKKVKVK